MCITLFNWQQRFNKSHYSTAALVVLLCLCMVIQHQKDEQNYVNGLHLSGKIMILDLICREASFSEASHTIESLWADLRLPVSLSRPVSILCAIDILVSMTFCQIQTYLWMTSTLILYQSTLSPIRRKPAPVQVIMKEHILIHNTNGSDYRNRNLCVP